MYVSNFCHLSDIIRSPLRTNSLYEKPTVVFSPHTPHGRVRLACFTSEDRALRKRPKTTVLQSTLHRTDLFSCQSLEFFVQVRFSNEPIVKEKGLINLSCLQMYQLLQSTRFEMYLLRT